MTVRDIVAAAALITVAAWSAQARSPDADFGVTAFMGAKADAGLTRPGRTVVIRGVRIYYETYGAGPPVLVLHGGTAFLETMHNQISALSPHHEVIAPDSRAHGRSTDGAGPLHYHAMAEDMIALMDRLHIAKADVVGWSDGGIVGLDLAIRHPSRVGRLVVMGANYDVSGLIVDGPPPPPDDPSYDARRAFYRAVSPTPDRWSVFIGKVATLWRSEPHYTALQLARIGSPVLVLAGEHDAVRRAHTDALAHAIPHAREVIIPGADHMAPLTNPAAVDEAITTFLDGPETSR